jgi:hypothetical protein
LETLLAPHTQTEHKGVKGEGVEYWNMADEKALKHALTRFRGFRSHVCGSVTVQMVEEYHSILTMLQEASGENLIAFRIPDSVINQRIVSEVRRYRTHLRSAVEPQYSSQKYCDKDIFKAKMDQLWGYFAKAPVADPSWQKENS